MKNKRGEIKKLEVWQILLVIIILVATAILIYSPHFSYPYPFHIDEWHHIEIGERILDNNYKISDVSNGNFEMGYHLFLAGLFSVEKDLGIDPVLAYKFLPAIFACLASIILFFMMFKLTKNYWIAIFSMLFFATLKTNVNLLGLWFAIPLTFCIPFIFLFFWLFIEGWNENPKLIIPACLVFLAILFCHACSAIFMLPILLVYILINHKPLPSGKKRWPELLLFLIPLLAFLFVYFEFIKKTSFFSSILFIFKSLIFEFGYTPTEPYLMPGIKLALLKKIILIHPYLLPWLFGAGAFILALIGLFISLKNKKLRLFAIWFLITAVLLALFINFKFTIFAPYQRMVYYSLLCLVPLAAIGLSWIIDIIGKKDPKRKNLWIFLIILITFYFSLFNYYDMPQGFGLYRLVDSNDYDALNFLGKQTSNSIVLAPVQLGDAIYPLSRNFAIAAPFFIGDTNSRNYIFSFFSNSSCEKQNEIIQKYNPQYIFSKQPMNCSNFKNIYSNGDYIYKVSNS